MMELYFAIIDEILAANADKVAEYKAGKEKCLHFCRTNYESK